MGRGTTFQDKAMQKLGYFTPYIPKNLPAEIQNFVFFRNEAGQDFHELKSKEGFFVSVDVNGIVLLTSDDITTLVPDNLTVYKIGNEETKPDIGWCLKDGVFHEPEKQELPLTPVTRKQLIDVLIDHDLDGKVEPALNAIADDKARKKALNAWRNASQYEPDHPLVLQLKGVLKLTNEQFDVFWREAMAA